MKQSYMKSKVSPNQTKFIQSDTLTTWETGGVAVHTFYSGDKAAIILGRSDTRK